MLCGWRQCWGHCATRALALGTLFFAASIPPSPANAEEDASTPKSEYGWREAWGGADVSKDVWLLYTGVTIAPYSKDIYSDGWRLRLNGGYGEYHYSQTVHDCSQAIAAGNLCRSVSLPVFVNHTYAEALVGYHLRLGELTAKAFGGFSMIDHKLAGGSVDTQIQGFEAGVTGALEFWLNIGTQGWTSLDLKYTTAHDTGSVRWRAGWRVAQKLSVGPELRLDTNVYDDAGRAGAFARYEWLGGEFSVAGGYASSIDGGLSLDPAPYFTVNLLNQF